MSCSCSCSVFVLFALVAVVASEVTEDECKKLGHPHALHCCKSLKDDPERFTELKECFNGKMRSGPGGPPPPPDCEMDKCIGKKKGYFDKDGKIDKAALEKSLEEEFKRIANDAALKFSKRECIDGDSSGYGPPDACDLARVRYCVTTGLIVTCTEFDDSKPHCADIKAKVEECKSVLNV